MTAAVVLGKMKQILNYNLYLDFGSIIKKRTK